MENVNQIETTETAPQSETKVSKGNGYPFISRREIVAQLETSSQFRLECLAILVDRQTTDELEAKATKHTNKRGLRCSEASWFPSLLAKINNAPDEVTRADYDRLAATLPKYRKQLAAHFRAMDLDRNPELAAQAAKFGL